MIRSYVTYGMITLWILLLLLNSPFLKNILFLSNNFVYLYLGISLALSFFIIYKNPSAVLNKAFMVLWIILLINIVYYIFFDHSKDGFLYIAAKTATFTLIAVNLYYSYDYLIKNFSKIIVTAGFIVLLIGVVFNHQYFGGRYTGPFSNPNSLGWLSALLFGLTYLNHEKSRKKYLLLLFFLAMVMMSGSRAAIGGVFLAILLKGSISTKKIVLVVTGIGLLLVLQNVASHFGIQTGLDRIIKSEKRGEVFAGRASEYALGIRTISDEPIRGYGLDKYAWISPKVVRLSGLLRKDPNFVGNPHNSFIAMFIMYGIPLGIVVFLVLLAYILKIVFSKIERKDLLFMVLFSFIGATFESYLFGVSGFEGLIFWIALPMALLYLNKTILSPRAKQG